jgi:hypothetical protein
VVIEVEVLEAETVAVDAQVSEVVEEATEVL